jgi:hypothetical protein
LKTKNTQIRKLISQHNYFNHDDEIYGKDFGYWIVKFWNTLGYSGEKKNESPVYCVSSPFKRVDQYTIPQDKAILFSPIKYITAIPESKFDSKMRKEMIHDVEYEMDIVQDMNMFLDRELVSPYCTRIKSPFFSLQNRYIALCDGYWLMLKPYALNRASHHVHMFSSCAAGKIQIASEYWIETI